MRGIFALFPIVADADAAAEVLMLMLMMLLQQNMLERTTSLECANAIFFFK